MRYPALLVAGLSLLVSGTADAQLAPIWASGSPDLAGGGTSAKRVQFSVVD